MDNDYAEEWLAEEGISNHEFEDLSEYGLDPEDSEIDALGTIGDLD